MTHFKISIIKSIIRIIGCVASVVLAFSNIIAAAAVLAAALGLAEVLGILEEVFDKRKEN